MMDLFEAIQKAKEGAAIRFNKWGPNDPSFLLFVTGRTVQPFEAIKQHLGDQPFKVADHLDAYNVTVMGDKIVGAACTVGYNFSQREILESHWEIV